MSGYTVELKGVDELSRKLQEAGRGEYIRGALEAAGLDLVTKARQYPPVPEGSKYQRTYKLQNSWGSQVSNDGMVLAVGTNQASVPYAGYVMGREEQTRTHAWHGWKTIEGIIQLNLDRITEALRRNLEKALNG